MYTLTALTKDGKRVFFGFDYTYGGRYPKWTEKRDEAVGTEYQTQLNLWRSWTQSTYPRLQGVYQYTIENWKI